jgi:hypothetical protein
MRRKLLLQADIGAEPTHLGEVTRKDKHKFAVGIVSYGRRNPLRVPLRGRGEGMDGFSADDRAHRAAAPGVAVEGGVF